jgi:hypothetical protein
MFYELSPPDGLMRNPVDGLVATRPIDGVGAVETAFNPDRSQ